jgi:hypothetical protein
MKQALTVLTLLALIAPVNATGLRMFFAPEGVADDVTPLGGISPTIANEATVGGGRYYIWAQIQSTVTTDQYISCGFNVVATGDVTITGRSIYNYYNEAGEATRWNAYNPGVLTPGKLDNVRLAGAAGGNGNIRDKNWLSSDFQWDPTTKATLLGYVDVVGTAGGLFFQVGDLGIIRTGATWEAVYFGVGDETLGVKGGSKQKPVGDETGFLLDGTVTPEPASLLLLGLAGLVLRRR